MSTIDFTEAELRRFSPKMADFYVRALLNGKAHLADAGILVNGRHFSHFMGQFGGETNGGTILRESLTYTTVKRIREVWPARARKETDAFLKTLVRNPVKLGDWAYGGRMGNRKGTSDGYDYRGGGFIQTTGRYAVQAYCDRLKIEIRPDILDDPEATLRFACAEWKDAGCNELADANDLLGISKAINVGSATSGVIPNGMEHRTAWFNKAKAIWWDAEPAEAVETATVVASVKETAAPPTKAAQVSTMLQFSRTLFGILTTIIGGIVYIYRETVDLFVAAAAQYELLSPVAKVLTALGASTAAAALIIAVAGLGMSFFAKVDDTVKGRVLK